MLNHQSWASFLSHTPWIFWLPSKPSLGLQMRKMWPLWCLLNQTTHLSYTLLVSHCCDHQLSTKTNVVTALWAVNASMFFLKARIRGLYWPCFSKQIWLFVSCPTFQYLTGIAYHSLCHIIIPFLIPYPLTNRYFSFCPVVFSSKSPRVLSLGLDLHPEMLPTSVILKPSEDL